MLREGDEAVKESTSSESAKGAKCNSPGATPQESGLLRVFGALAGRSEVDFAVAALPSYSFHATSASRLPKQ